MPDGSKWDVPAHVVADNRAKYYAKYDEDANYQEEYDYTYNDNSELLDWAANNMNWDDVSHLAKRVALPPQDVDYQEGWVNGEKEIINLE
jgi:hypothetical protein